MPSFVSLFHYIIPSFGLQVCKLVEIMFLRRFRRLWEFLSFWEINLVEPFQFSKWPILTEWLPALFHSTLFPFSQARLSHNLTTQYVKVYATQYTFKYIYLLSESDSDLTYMRLTRPIYFHSRLFFVSTNKLILGFARL